MRVVIQRVTHAKVEVHKNKIASINKGLLILLGIEQNDSQQDIDWLCNKILNLRIFSDQQNKMNLSLLDIKGDVLIVSQFTLYASIKKGNRPYYIKAASPIIAKQLYQKFIDTFTSICSLKVETGSFGANMQILLLNDGPVTIIIDSKQKE